MKNEIQKSNHLLIDEVKELILEAKQAIATTANSALTILYWNIGNRVNTEILKSRRADYGKQIVILLSQKLTEEFGKGWSDKHLRHCLRFAETFPDREIVYALSRELSWTHFRILIYIGNELSRSFYLEMCRLEGWNTRVLSDKLIQLGKSFVTAFC
jgi:hypothetical protein